MKVSKKAQEFLSKNKGDTKIRNLLNLGGRVEAKKDFFTLLKRAVQPSKS